MARGMLSAIEDFLQTGNDEIMKVIIDIQTNMVSVYSCYAYFDYKYFSNNKLSQA